LTLTHLQNKFVIHFRLVESPECKDQASVASTFQHFCKELAISPLIWNLNIDFQVAATITKLNQLIFIAALCFNPFHVRFLGPLSPYVGCLPSEQCHLVYAQAKLCLILWIVLLASGHGEEIS
jgi:hypothetical protein